MISSISVHTYHRCIEPDLTPQSFYFGRYRLPHLPRTIFWVEELFDEAGMIRPVILFKGAPHGMFDQSGDVQVLYPLPTPVRGDLFTGDAPDLVRVILEKGGVELLSKTIDKEFCEVIFRFDREEP